MHKSAKLFLLQNLPVSVITYYLLINAIESILMKMDMFLIKLLTVFNTRLFNFTGIVTRDTYFDGVVVSHQHAQNE